MQDKNICLATWGLPAVGHVQRQPEFPRGDPGGKAFSPQLYFDEGRSLPATTTGKHVIISLATVQQSQHEGARCPRDQIPSPGRYFHT